jgi:heme/copper-type cytochrome/quinol oxidase subunit 3
MVSALATVVDVPPRRRRAPRRTNGNVPPPPPGGDGDGPDRDPDPRRPFLDNAQLATLFLIGAEVMLFAGLVSGFFVLRIGAPVWPPPLQPRLPIVVTGLNTLVLLGSSVAMIWALRASMTRVIAGRLAIAGALGVAFLLVQGSEWVRLIRFGLTVSSGAYGATFYTLIGAHALHVVGALVWLAIVTTFLVRGRLAARRPAALRACAMYWHFVVGLWPVLYVVVYLT